MTMSIRWRRKGEEKIIIRSSRKGKRQIKSRTRRSDL
jgi:hypothetical protein